MGQNVHVVPSENGWLVRPEGSKHVNSIHQTQEAAIDAALENALREHSELIVYGPDGKIRQKR